MTINFTTMNKEVPEWERTTKLVIRDLIEREAFGLQKYGKYLSQATDEDMLNHLYNELLDGACYIRTLMEQRGFPYDSNL